MTSRPNVLPLVAISALIALSITPVYAQDDPFLLASPAGARVLNLPAKDLVYDPVSQRIYASMPSSAGIELGNTITTINPRTGEIETSVFIGSEPGPLAVSDDGEYLYVGLDGAAAIRRFHIPSQTAGLQFSLGSDSFFGPYFAEDIEVLPGNSNAVAVSRFNAGISPRHAGVAVYDDGVVRPNTTQRHTGSNRIEFSDSAALLYGYNNETTEFGFRTIAVTPDGVSEIAVVGSLITGFRVDIEFEDGLVYATTGQVVDPDTLSLVGTYASSGPVEADARLGRVFFVEHDFSSGRWFLMTFDLERFVLLDFEEITGIPSLANAGSLIGWGFGGLAFRTDHSQVFILPELQVDDDDLVAGFGPGVGTWKWMNDSQWVELHTRSPEAIVTGDLDGSGQYDTVVDFGPDVGLWNHMNDDTWVKLHWRSPELLATGNLDGESVIAEGPDVPLAIPDNSLGGVVSALDVAADLPLTDVNVRVVIDHTWVGDLKIVLRSPAGTEVVLLDRPGVPAFGEFGCNDMNMDVTFDSASSFNPENHCALTDPGSDPWYVGLAAPVSSLSAFNGESTAGTWSLIVSDHAPGDTGTLVDWQLLTSPDIAAPVGRDDVIVGFPTLGTWKWMNDSEWVKLHWRLPEVMVTGDLDGNGQDDVLIDFGAPVGLWQWMNDSDWVKLHGRSPELMVTGDLDNSGRDDVVIDFGATVGLWRWMNDSEWLRLHWRSPEVMATGNFDGL